MNPDAHMMYTKEEGIRLLSYVYSGSSETGLISFKYLRDEVMNNMISNTCAHTPIIVLSQHHSILIIAKLRVIDDCNDKY